MYETETNCITLALEQGPRLRASVEFSLHLHQYGKYRRMQHRTIKIYLTTLTLAAIGTAGAAVIHVPADQPTIQQGIDAASNGDTVAVAAGHLF